jgi:ribosome-binding protein aMBF1 (putative translation factor)
MANSNDDRCDICNKKVIPKSTNCIMESGILYCSRCYTDYGIADPDNLRADDYPQF